MSQPGEITHLLQEAENGNADAANQLFTLVQDELKMIARKRLRAAEANLELSTTELVDDAFMQLVGRDKTSWHTGDRRKFFGYASIKMHDLLIESMRSQNAVKRGGRHQRVEGEPEVQDGGQSVEDLQQLLDLKAALDKFEAFAPADAMLFRVRYFLGCTFEEAAEIVAMSVTESKRAFQRARLWLQNELKEYRK